MLKSNISVLSAAIARAMAVSPAFLLPS